MNIRNFIGLFRASLVSSALLLSSGVLVAQDAAPEISTKLWPALMTPHADKARLLGIARAGDTLVAVGGNGVIVRSSDGKSWRQVSSPVDVALNSVAFADASTGWAVGHDALVLATTDGGQTWKVQNFQPALNSPLFSVQALSKTTAIAVGAFGLLKITEDGGANWTDVSAPEFNAESLHVNAVTRLPNGKLVAVGERGLLGVSDDGRQWRRIPAPYEGSFFGVLPWGAEGALAFGMRGNAYYTTNAETGSWSKLELGTTASFFGGQVLGNDRLILTGAEAQVLMIDGQQKVERVDTSSLVSGQPITLTGAASLGDRLVAIGETGAKTLQVQGP